MKYKVLMIFLFLASHQAFGQADGVYRIMYTGNLTIDHREVTKIKVPTTAYLHGYENDSSEFAFRAYELKNSSFKIQIGSHLTSELFDNPNAYLSKYKAAREFVKVILLIRTTDGTQQIEKKIYWHDITMRSVNDEGFGNLFQINLGEIKVKN